VGGGKEGKRGGGGLNLFDHGGREERKSQVSNEGTQAEKGEEGRKGGS